MERRTRQRNAITDAITHIGRPVSAQEILALTHEAMPTLGIATVYRAIKELLAEGWLRQVDIPLSQPRYEKVGKGQHHHFHCRTCDRVYEVDGHVGNLRRLTPARFQMEDYEIVINGLCAGCVPKT